MSLHGLSRCLLYSVPLLGFFTHKSALFFQSSLFPGSDLVHFYYYFFVNLGDYIVLQGRLKKASTLLAEVDRRCRFVGRLGWEHDDGGASKNKRINNKCAQDHLVGLLALTSLRFPFPFPCASHKRNTPNHGMGQI